MSFSQLDLFGKLHHGEKIIDFPFFFLFAEFSEIANWLCNDLIYRKARIHCSLTMMELPEEIKLRKAHELSGGQQKRVCIARALAAQPDVLIFDEAVSGLDVLVRKHILDLLKRLHQERKMTCFFITHDLDVALYLADRVMVMRCGKIIEDRTFHGSTDCFTHPYTKLLLHSIAPYLG